MNKKSKMLVVDSRIWWWSSRLNNMSVCALLVAYFFMYCMCSLLKGQSIRVNLPLLLFSLYAVVLAVGAQVKMTNKIEALELYHTQTHIVYNIYVFICMSYSPYKTRYENINISEWCDILY